MKRHGLRVAATLAPLALALGACKSVGPDYTLPQHAYVNAPLANHALDDANGALVSRDAVPGNWWQLYDDPVLDGLVRDALKSNTDLRVAAANLARSRAALVVANEQGGFSGGAEAAVQRAQESAEQYLLENKLPVVNEGTVGINVSYELDLFGKLRRGVEAARADSEAVKAAGDLARITVVADVVRAYVEACSAGDELAIAKQSLALQQQRVKLSQRLRDAGRGNQTDVTRGVTQVRTLSADIPRFEGRRKVAQYQLAALLARAGRSAEGRRRVRTPAEAASADSDRRRRGAVAPPPRRARSRAAARRRDRADRRGDRRAVPVGQHRRVGRLGRRRRRSVLVHHESLVVRSADQLVVPRQRPARACARPKPRRAAHSRTSTASC